ncbi:hypothetical protein CsatA_001775 [Cannabis sativa]
MRLADERSTYLGLSCVMRSNKDAILGLLKDKMQKRIQSWKGRFLSTVGREVLLKIVAQALPSFAMSVFLLPLKTCSHLKSLMTKYWWSLSGRKGVSWFIWRKLCKNKNSGGMGFQSLREYNLSLLGKHGWRLLVYQDSLVGRIYKARYFSNCTFLEAELGGNPSFIWRSVFKSQTLLKDGARSRIGPGSSTEVLNTPWLLSEDNQCVVSYHPALTNCKVSQLMKPGSR